MNQRSSSRSSSKRHGSTRPGRPLRAVWFAVAMPLLLVVTVAAQAPAPAQAWFGQALPGPAADGVTPPFDTTRTDIPALPATFGPGPRTPELAGPRIKKDLRAIVGFSLKSRANGDYLWGRISGMPAYHETATWAVEQLRAAGLKDARLEEFTTTLTIPVAGELRLLRSAEFGAGTEDITLRSAIVGGTSPDGTVTAPLLYVGRAANADLLGRDLAGKIAVLRSTPNPWSVQHQ